MCALAGAVLLWVLVRWHEVVGQERRLQAPALLRCWYQAALRAQLREGRLSRPCHHTLVVQMRPRCYRRHLAVHPVELIDVLVHLAVHQLYLLHVLHILHYLVHFFELRLVDLDDLLELGLVLLVLRGLLLALCWPLGVADEHLLRLLGADLGRAVVVVLRDEALLGINWLVHFAFYCISRADLILLAFVRKAAVRVQGFVARFHGFAIVEQELQHDLDGAELLAHLERRCQWPLVTLHRAHRIHALL